MTKMDKLWVTVAKLLYPETHNNHLVDSAEIKKEYKSLFGVEISPHLIFHLISWKARNIDKENPSRGGSRNRYFFKTDDGINPSLNGGYRLYKNTDSFFDGEGKDGPICPHEDRMPVEFHFLRNWYLEDYQDVAEQRNIEECLVETQIVLSNLSVTEKEMLIKSRRGQGVFKTRVAMVESSCRITGLKNLKFLVASHIKPWAKCNNQERLDGSNGLLLSPHVDMLFDNGYITFQKNGEIIVAPEANEVISTWGLVTTRARSLTEEQESYMQYHRKNLFRGK